MTKVARTDCDQLTELALEGRVVDPKTKRAMAIVASVLIEAGRTKKGAADVRALAARYQRREGLGEQNVAAARLLGIYLTRRKPLASGKPWPLDAGPFYTRDEELEWSLSCMLTGLAVHDPRFASLLTEIQAVVRLVRRGREKRWQGTRLAAELLSLVNGEPRAVHEKRIRDATFQQSLK